MKRLWLCALLSCLSLKCQTSNYESMNNHELLISADRIQSKINEIAQELDDEYQGEEITVVMVMKGALCLTADLIRALKTPCKIDYVKGSSYGQHGSSRGELKITGLDNLDLKDKHVLLVDDIFDSGETLTQIFAQIRDKEPKTLKSLVLLAKNVTRDTYYYPDYVLFEIENKFVIGYGLDYKELYRGLPGVFIYRSQ